MVSRLLDHGRVNLGNKDEWNAPGLASYAGGGWADTLTSSVPGTSAHPRSASLPFSPRKSQTNIGKEVKAIAWLNRTTPLPTIHRLCVHFDPLTQLHLRSCGKWSRQVAAWWIAQSGITNCGDFDFALITPIWVESASQRAEFGWSRARLGTWRASMILGNFERNPVNETLMGHELPKNCWTDDPSDWHVIVVSGQVQDTSGSSGKWS